MLVVLVIALLIVFALEPFITGFLSAIGAIFVGVAIGTLTAAIQDSYDL
jgi:hypothetical protein